MFDGESGDWKDWCQGFEPCLVEAGAVEEVVQEGAALMMVIIERWSFRTISLITIAFPAQPTPRGVGGVAIMSSHTTISTGVR
jgi:hypothetical protein